MRSPSHASFLQTLLKRHKRGSLTAEQLRTLGELGVPWAQVSGAETELLTRVGELSRKYGKVNLEAILRLHPEVAEWVRTCKERLSAGTLDDSIAAALEKYGVRFPRPIVEKVRVKP